jgi:hypothetical protein
MRLLRKSLLLLENNDHCTSIVIDVSRHDEFEFGVEELGSTVGETVLDGRHHSHRCNLASFPYDGYGHDYADINGFPGAQAPNVCRLFWFLRTV